MFQQSIERVAAFTRPIHTITRTYGNRNILPAATTLFFVNEEGYAVTCKHVADMLIRTDTLSQQYAAFRSERNQLPRDGKFKQRLKGLELKYKYTPDTLVQAKNTFLDCVDTLSGFTVHAHPHFDLAIIKFNGYNKLHYTGHAVFKKDTAQIKAGVFLCRLGFPFSEFSNFRYNETADDIEWTDEGIKTSPRFPIEGMVTRFLADGSQTIYGIEMSTPGLRGQSGGPLFDSDGVVYGMQFSTKHLHLGFDLTDKEILLRNKPQRVSDHPFLHLGQCIHADIIKVFLASHGVKYYEE